MVSSPSTSPFSAPRLPLRWPCGHRATAFVALGSRPSWCHVKWISCDDIDLLFSALFSLCVCVCDKLFFFIACFIGEHHLWWAWACGWRLKQDGEQQHAWLHQPVFFLVSDPMAYATTSPCPNISHCCMEGELWLLLCFRLVPGIRSLNLWLCLCMFCYCWIKHDFLLLYPWSLGLVYLDHYSQFTRSKYLFYLGYAWCLYFCLRSNCC